MSYDGPTPTKFGQYGVAEPFRAATFHVYKGEALATSDFEPPVPVLDQEDLLSQGIDTSALVPGAQKVDALGSCTCNAGTVSLAERYKAARGTLPPGLSGDAVADEEYAILLYRAVTGQTGNPAQEWPPVDCGSTGLYVCQQLESQGLIASYKSASGIHAVVSLLQDGTAIMGGPWFNAWMEPDSGGFVDGDGSVEALQNAIASGVAGGHETCITAVERLSLDAAGVIYPAASHVRVRNSWSSSFGDHGSFRIHLSTLQLLGSHVDYKQFEVSAS